MHRNLLLAGLFLVVPGMALAETLPVEPAPPTEPPATMCPGARGSTLRSTLQHCWCRMKAHLCPDPGPFGDYLLYPSDHTPQRAGYPPCVAKYAQPSDTGKYSGGYVGGGNPCRRKGDGPCAEEGTWGWDYAGCLWHRSPFLAWWHRCKYQGGTGAYKTDGPPVPEPPPLYHAPEHCEH